MSDKNLIIWLALAGCVCLAGCTALERKNQAGAVAEVSGRYLYQSTIDSLTLGLNSEDSMRVAQNFVSQWAKDNLLYDKASSRRSDRIEKLVDEYRRSLYMHAYENELVERRMPKTIMDSAIMDLYSRIPDRFRLTETIAKGLLLVIPVDAPKGKKIRQWLTEFAAADTVPTELMDEIEKYAYQYASVYELFDDRWMTTGELIAMIPVERADMEARLRQSNRIEISDTAKTYILQLTEKHLRGEQMPVEYARPEIEKIILSTRRVDFLQRERERIYKEAIQQKKIVFY